MNCMGTRTKPYCKMKAEFVAYEQADGCVEPVKICSRCLPGVVIGRSDWGVCRI